MPAYDPYESLPGHIVTENLLSLTRRVEQLEMDIKRLEGVIISWSEERNSRKSWKAAVRHFAPGKLQVKEEHERPAQ